MNKYLITVAIFSISFVMFSSAMPIDEENSTTETQTEVETTVKSEIIPEKEPKTSDVKPKKTQRNYPQTYYVSSKVNGRFGKSVRAFTSDEFYEQYPQN